MNRVALAAGGTNRSRATTGDPGSRRCWFDYAVFPEPTLRDLLDDPLVRLLMRSDRVGASELEALVAAITGPHRSDIESRS